MRDDGPVRDEAEVVRYIERFASELADAGMQRMAARVFAALLAADSASMTSAELAESLRISPAAVSSAIAYLSQVRMVHREREPGSRRDRYRLHDELWYETYGERDKLMARFEIILRDGANALGPNTPAGARARESAEFFAFLQAEFTGVMDRWRNRERRPPPDHPPRRQGHPIR
ncbi:GbsR/MarR family transcriptional regulator [Embleya scabrispora]|uniref:GbsR/MarR family transcriptional regulator n=1 Tax=Embleya scabrispora TaxID=159449 RepID=UPI0003A19C4F|nr:MarR family transcriptional regulator [Embleya scabrispora]MYS87691.1 MarR family transcriptional regulator [Streptomyces sp. SID5474]